MSNVPGFNNIAAEKQNKYLTNAACHEPGISNEKCVELYDKWADYDKVIFY